MKKMNVPHQMEPKLRLQQQQQVAAAVHKQKVQQKQQAVTNSTRLSSTTPTLNTITLQNSSQGAFNFPGTVVAGQRLTKTKSNPGAETVPTPIQPARQLSNDNLHGLQARTQPTITHSAVQEGGRVLVTRHNSSVNAQTITMNSSALATALGQISGAVNVQVPVMAVAAQRAPASSQYGQSHGTAAVIRMPVASGGNSSRQITGVNLLSGGQNVLGNIQLATCGSGITIPVSQLPANIAMQLTSIANANPQQISMIATSSASTSTVHRPTSQQISFVDQSGNTTPFAIVANANNETWQVQGNSNVTTNQPTYAIAPRMQIAPTTSRPNQTQQVQVVRQLQIPAHLLTMSGQRGNERVKQLRAAQAMKNAKKRRTTPE